MTFIDKARAILGETGVLTGADLARFETDVSQVYTSTPLCVLRPANTDEVAAVMALANEHAQPIIPVSGHTGVTGATQTDGAALLSLERMNRIRDIRADARIAKVEAGVVLDRLREAAEDVGLTFPVVFGARGSAMLGGLLSTNAGGSNVLRYGNTRAQVLGIEAVLADGRVMDLMTALHKDNSGYDLRDLLIGAEGTLAVITAAVVRLSPRPPVLATAMVAPVSLPAALEVLNRLQDATGGAVEACEYMPRSYIERHLAYDPTAREPFEAPHEVNVLVEVGGQAEVGAQLEEALAAAMEDGLVVDAVIAASEAQRASMWDRREAAARVLLAAAPPAQNDVALPIDQLAAFFERIDAALIALDPGAQPTCVAHLGDGNVHQVTYVSDPALAAQAVRVVDEIAVEMGGTFSAEHGVGLAKRKSMAALKDPVALDVMRAVKAALDPKGILNPGKVIPD